MWLERILPPKAVDLKSGLRILASPVSSPSVSVLRCDHKNPRSSQIAPSFHAAQDRFGFLEKLWIGVSPGKLMVGIKWLPGIPRIEKNPVDPHPLARFPQRHFGLDEGPLGPFCKTPGQKPPEPMQAKMGNAMKLSGPQITRPPL